MQCDVMKKLHELESQARADCNTQTEYVLQAVYGQHCLEAQRMQKVHWDGCEVCQNEQVTT
jgi:hypothetical protein